VYEKDSSFACFLVNAVVLREEFVAPPNGFYLNGELISRMDGNMYGWINERGYYFGFTDSRSNKMVGIKANRDVWDSDYVDIMVRDYWGMDLERIGRGLTITKAGPGKEMSGRYYETVTGRLLEEVSVVNQNSGLLEIKEIKGTWTGYALVDVSFTLSNGDEYKIFYCGEVDTAHIIYD
jgi:hypothetical protein